MSIRILASFPSQVRFVYRHWPLENHRFAYPAARAAECAAEQGRLWDMHRLLYAKRDSLGLLSFADFARRAALPSLDQFEACNRRSEPIPAIEGGIRDAKAAGGTGTPTTIVNGVLKRHGVDSAYIARLVAQVSKR
jgi:protein-disulfide isomerase